jgi:hypothetical protein
MEALPRHQPIKYRWTSADGLGIYHLSPTGNKGSACTAGGTTCQIRLKPTHLAIEVPEFTPFRKVLPRNTCSLVQCRHNPSIWNKYPYTQQAKWCTSALEVRK